MGRVARQTVISWRDRYASSGVKGLDDEQRSGRPRTVDRGQDLVGDPDAAAGEAGGHALVVADAGRPSQNRRLDGVRTWRHHRVQPWRAETFKFCTDPELVAKVTDVVGLYLNPPENAIVLSVPMAAGVRKRWSENLSDSITRSGQRSPWRAQPGAASADLRPAAVCRVRPVPVASRDRGESRGRLARLEHNGAVLGSRWRSAPAGPRRWVPLKTDGDGDGQGSACKEP
ncbi:MAG: family transposase, partial [Friedmanniella sp.]|nr:family transposase [Friedmanniella sp.]